MSVRRLALIALIGAAGTARAQVSTLYLTDPFHGHITTLQGGVLTPWSTGAMSESPLAVWGDIRTVGYDGSAGSQYALDGGSTGTTYPGMGASGIFAGDGTSIDGTYNALANYPNGEIIVTDTNWGGFASGIFNTGGHPLGLTFDKSNISMWVADFQTGTITDYSLISGFYGNVLSSFQPLGGVTNIAALALDPADNSLWFFDEATATSTVTFYQYSKDGTLLSWQEHPDRAGYDTYYGGEFDGASASLSIDAIAAPEPSTIALTATGLVGLAGVVRKRRRAKIEA